MMEEAVGERPTELLVKEDEQQRDLGSFLCQAISVTLLVSGEQPMRCEFAQIVSELVKFIAVGADAEGGQNGFVDVAGGPAGYYRSSVQHHFHQADHARVVDLDAGILGRSNCDG